MFDFDYWMELYKRDPEQYHVEYESHIQEAIGNLYPNDSYMQNRLTRIIETVNKEVAMIEDPEIKLKVMQQLLHNKLKELNERMTGLQEVLSDDE